MSFHSPTLRHPGAAGIGLLSVLLLAACGASSTTAPSTSSPSTAAGTSKPSSSAATPTSAAVSTTCPTSAEIATLTGTTFPAPQQASSTGSLVCSYNDTTSGANLVFEVTAAPGTTAGALQIAAGTAASPFKVTASSVSGFGSAAYAFTANDASTNSSGVATSVILILDGSDLIDITAELTLAKVEAVATYVLAH